MTDAKSSSVVPEKQRSFSDQMRAGFESLRLESIHISEEGKDDLLALDQGKITKQQLIDRALSRVKSRAQ